MPKLKKQFDPWERYRGALLGRMFILGYGFAELASRMDVSVPTARKYVMNPGTMSLDDMRKANRILDIEAEEARGLLPMK
jgi:hypothetical protein